MAQTVADQMVEVLAPAGVQRVYGVVGHSLNGFTDAMRRRGSMQWLHVRHEEVADFAAGADAHITGNLAVCAGSCGPDNLHLINGARAELAMPPAVTVETAKGFSLYILKAILSGRGDAILELARTNSRR